MADCPVTLEGPLDYGNGKGVLWKITPAPLPDPACTCTFFLDGHVVNADGPCGPYHVSGKGRAHVLVEPPPETKINVRVEVRCPECQSTLSRTSRPLRPPMSLLEKIVGPPALVIFGTGAFLFCCGFLLVLLPVSLVLTPFSAKHGLPGWWDALKKFAREYVKLIGKLF